MENKHTEDKAHKIHHPEYVILDKEEVTSTTGPGQEYIEYMDTLQKIGKMKFGWPLRIMCFSGAFIAAAGIIFTALAATISILLAALVLFSNKEVNASMYKTLRGLRKCCVITLGLLVAVLSPALGLGMIVLYFMLHGESLKSDLFNRVFSVRN